MTPERAEYLPVDAVFVCTNHGAVPAVVKFSVPNPPLSKSSEKLAGTKRAVSDTSPLIAIVNGFSAEVMLPSQPTNTKFGSGMADRTTVAPLETTPEDGVTVPPTVLVTVKLNTM